MRNRVCKTDGENRYRQNKQIGEQESLKNDFVTIVLCIFLIFLQMAGGNLSIFNNHFINYHRCLFQSSE